MCPEPVSETVSFLSEQFPTPSHVAPVHEMWSVCRSNLELSTGCTEYNFRHVRRQISPYRCSNTPFHIHYSVSTEW